MVTLRQISGLAIFVKITQFVEKGVVQFSKYSNIFYNSENKTKTN